MANYTIIGGDGKEYGPVTEADVRLWITEGRLNGQSLAKADGDAEFRQLALFPELAAAFAAAAPGPIAPLPSAGGAYAGAASVRTDFNGADYELDIGGCISRGWSLMKENFGTLFLCFLILLGIQIAAGAILNVFGMAFAKNLLQSSAAMRVGYGIILSAVLSLVVGPLTGGINLVYLKTIRGQATGVGEIFAGFQKAFVPLFLGSLVVTLIVQACMLPAKLVWEMKSGPLMEQLQHMQQTQPDPAAMQELLPQMMTSFMAVLPLFLVCLVPVTYLTVSWQFTLPLIIDREMDFGTAMKTSFKMVNKHFWQVLGLTIVVGLVVVAGLLACCIGILFTIPLGVAAMMYAYETIFGGEKA